MYLNRAALLLLTTLPAFAVAATLEEATDLGADSTRSARLGAPGALLVTAGYCGYCERVKEDLIEPMAAGGAYQDGVLFREVTVNRYDDLDGFDGSPVTPAGLGSRYGLQVTPAPVFVDGRGRGRVPPLVGLTTADVYGLYLDAALERARQRLQGDVP